ncbi:hypothetical protein Acr_03g0009650 [Actinidia rufa]|uniref:Uncharacterized protein n=1 Tax=Actinidia rufa TaxID=165716 RepID=A0A7J0ECJ0_9ERIC|nr:hypothetical protein Acr_03g0009650 [Actinidia rufa]
MLSDADYAPEKPKMRNEMNRKMIGQIRQCIGHEHDEMSAHGLWTKLKEMYREKTSQNKVLLRRLVLKLQRGTTVAEQTSEFQRATGRGQKKRPEKRSQEGGHRGQEKRRDKKNCPRNKAQDQSSEAATTAMMAVDESDVSLAASADEESDWISDSGIAYHLTVRFRMADGRSMKVTGVRHVSLRCRSRSDEASGGTLRVSKGNRRSCKRRKTGRLYRLRENVQTGELLSDIGSTVEQERKEMLWNTCGSLARHEKVQPLQDVHEEAQRRETESMHNDRRDVARNESLSLEISGGNLSSCAHKGGEMESRRLAKRRTLQSTPTKENGKREEEKRKRCSDRSCQRRRKEDCIEVSDGGSLLLHCQEWGLYELSHELICSSLWPIKFRGQTEKRGGGCREM